LTPAASPRSAHFRMIGLLLMLNNQNGSGTAADADHGADLGLW
jgi:hypothetical protein